MKKFLLLALLALGMSSCSKDDDTAAQDPDPVFVDGGSVVMKVDGATKTYNTIAVDTQLDDFNEPVYIDVTASQNGSATEFVTFQLGVGEVGANHLSQIQYTSNGVQDNFWTSFSSNTLINSNHRLKTNFAGVLERYNSETGEYTTTAVSDGVIDITYE
jgi:hypothetical protein